MTARVAVVIPVFNEADRFPVERFLGFLAAHPDVLACLVDDGSTDASPRLLERIAEALPDRVRVLRHAENRGKAEAVRSGVTALGDAGPRYIGYADADLSADPEELLRLADELDAHPQAWIAIGSRVRLLGRDIRRSAVRHVLGRVFATCASLALRLAVYDTQCGLKLFRPIEPVRAAFAQPFGTRWYFDVELLARLAVMPGPPMLERFREVPLTAWHGRAGTRLRLRDVVLAPVHLARIAVRYRR